MTDDGDHLLGLVTAHDLMLRFLFAAWAKAQPDPRAAAEGVIEATLAQLRARRGDAPAHETATFEVAVEALREFQRHIDLRLQV